MMRVSREEVEILSPAGCFISLQAAIDAGADAIYFGLAQLNMRARARRSFQLKDLQEIMETCHKGGVKGYLTMNTLLYDHDLLMVDKMLEAAKKHNVDGVIVSDIASIQKANELGIEVHLSTQLSLSNSKSVEFYAQFCDRVVLARELTLPMIKKIRESIVEKQIKGIKGELIEIEAFAHGALCIAVSGRCGMSLFNSNASANRGACEQNCRKEYKVTDVETGKSLKIDNNFVMSPEDISTIDFMDEFLDSGVQVLKIEGRGRSPEYVAKVTRAYREAVDAVYDGSYGDKFVSDAYEEISSVYNRGLSSGYYLGKDQTWSAAHGSKATHQKVFAGKVKHFYNKIEVAEIEIQAGSISATDTIMILGKNTGVAEIKQPEFHLDGKPAPQANKGDLISLKVPQRVKPDDQVYIIKELATV